MNSTLGSRLFYPLKKLYNITNERCFTISPSLSHIMKLTRLRVVDNSNLGKQAMLDGKPPRCIHVYKKTGIGAVGDKVMVAIKGLKKRAYIVGVKGMKQVHMMPRFDSNNIVLLDDHGNPLGSRVLVPIPSALRGRREFSKIIALSSRFV